MASGVSSLTTANLAGMATTDLGLLTTADVVSLSTAQLAALSIAQLDAFYSTQISAFRTDELLSLGAAKLDALLSSQLSALTSKQIVALSTAQIKALRTANVASLQPIQLTVVRTDQLAALGVNSMAALDSLQVAALNSAQVAVFATAQIRAITADAIRSLDTLDLVALGPAQISALAVDQINALGSIIESGTSGSSDALLNSKLSVLTTAQTLALSTAQVAGMNTGSLDSLSTTQFAAMLSTQLRALSTLQLSKMETADLAALGSQQLAGLTTAQIAGLARSAIDRSGLFVGGTAASGLGAQTYAGGNSDALVARYLADGSAYDTAGASKDQTWLRLMGTASQSGIGQFQGRECANAIAFGPDGSVYSVGYVRGEVNGQLFAGGDRDAYLTKYSANGEVLWTQLLGTELTPSSGGTDSFNSVSVGPNGLIYVGGFTNGQIDPTQPSKGGNDGIVASFSDKNGVPKLESVQQFGSLGNDMVWAVSTGPDGSLVVAGDAAGPSISDKQSEPSFGGGTTDGFVTKLRPDGTLAWTQWVSSGGNDSNRSVKVAIDGQVYVLGVTTGTLNGQALAAGLTEDAYLIKYNADGSLAWSQFLGVGPQNLLMGLAIGPDGTVCVSGRTLLNQGTQNNNGNQDVYVAKYDAEGLALWKRLYGGSAREEAIGLTVGPDGSVYVGGLTNNATADGGVDGLLLKYSAKGVLAWDKQVGDAGSDWFTSLAVAPTYISLTTQQIASLSSAQINALGAQALMSSLSIPQMLALGSSQIASLSTATFTALTQEQFAGLKTSQLVAITITGTAALKPWQVLALTTAQAAALSPAQVRSFSIEQFVAIQNLDLAAISTAAMAVLRTNQINNLLTSQVVSITTSQITALTTAQLSAMLKKPDTVVALTTRQTVSISGDARVTLLTTSQLAALNSSQVASLTTAHISGMALSQLQAFTTGQFAAMRTQHIAALTTEQFLNLETADFAALTTSQIAAITTRNLVLMSTAEMVALTTLQVQALSTFQIRAISTQDIAVIQAEDLRAMRTSQIAALTTAQLATLAREDGADTLSLNDQDRQYWKPLALLTSQVRALGVAQINSLAAGGWMASFTTEQVAVWSSAQITGISALSINALNAQQIAALQTSQVITITTGLISALRSENLNALTTRQIAALTTAQIAALSTAQFPNLETADLVALTSAQVLAISLADVALLSTAEARALTPAQLSAFSSAQIGAIPRVDWSVFGPSQLAALKTSQLIAISSAAIGGFTTTQITAFTTQQITTLTPNQVVGLAKAANDSAGLYVGGAAGSGLGGQTFAGGNSDAMVARYLADGTGYDSSNAASAGTWLRLLGSDSMSGAGTRQYGHEIGTSLLRAADGSVYAVGLVRGSVNDQAYAGGERDAYLIKYGRDGSTQWTQLLGSTGTDSALSISMGANGLLYVVGNTTGVLPGAQRNGGNSDSFLVTYKDEGDHATRLDTKEYGDWRKDVAWSVSAAQDGSFYVAGASKGDGVLTKFQADGSVAWTRAVASWPVKPNDMFAGSGTDINRVVKAGADGSAIVLGITTGNLGAPAAQGTTPSEDAYLIKYNADGSVAWSKMLGVGPQDVEQGYRTMGLALGPDGSMCVTGRTALDMGGQSNKGNQDAFVAKYGADGSLIWSRLYGSDKFDEGVDVTVGPDGSVYVGGRTSLGTDSSWSPSMDALLLKYSADGTLQWSKQVGANGVDMLLALAIDPSYLTLNGAQVAALTSAQINALGAGSMMSTLSTGQLIALSTAQIVALSTQSITGLSQEQVGAFKTAQVVAISSTDVAALKATQIAALATAQAAALTSAQIQSFGQAQIKALVPTDFVALSTAVLAALRTDQVNVLSAAQLTALSTRQIALLGTAQIAALSSTQLIGLANDAIAVYASGMASSAVDGQSYAGGNGDALLVRYSANGSKVWTRLIGTDSMAGIDAPGLEEAMSVATGADGSVYTVGYVRGSVAGQEANGSACEAYLSKYSSNGTMVWTRLIGAVGTQWDWASSVTLGADGMVYVSGETSGKLNPSQAEVSGDSDVFVAKYDEKGEQQWTKLIGSVGADTGWYIRAGADGNLVLVGAMGAIPQQAGVPNGQTYGGGASDAFITKLSASGDVLWTQMLGSSAKDVASAVALGGDGAMYVAGKTGGNLSGQIKATGGDDIFVSKYNADGSLAWTRLMGSGPEESSGNMVGLVAAADGFVYVAARTNRSTLDGQVNPGGGEAFLIKLDAAGDKVWTRLATGPSWQGSDVLALGPDGAIYMGGWTGLTADDGGDALLVKYLPDGTQVWSQQFGGLGEEWFDGLAAVAGPIALATNQLMALSASQLNSLGGASLICTLGTAQLHALTTGQLAGLNGPSALALTLSQTAALATSQVNALSSAALNALSTAQLSVLRPAQLVALSTAQVLSLRTDKLDALTTQQFTSITTAQIAALSTAQVLGLETADFAVLGAAQLVALSTADIAVLSTAQVVALTTAQVPVLTTAQVQAISTRDIVAMQSDDVRALMTTQVAALTTGQVVAMVSAAKGVGSDGSLFAIGRTAANLYGQTNHGDLDGLISKYDANGNRVWSRLVGGDSFDEIISTNPVADGSVVLSGHTFSSTVDDQVNHGLQDGLITKYDASGNRVWTRLIGGESYDLINAVVIGRDGSVLVSGDTVSSAVDDKVSHGLQDGYVSKFDANGNLMWTRMVGGDDNELSISAVTSTDGSVLVSGITFSGTLDDQINHGVNDAFISKYDANGNRQWTRLVGGEGNDWINSATTGADGSVLVSGQARSSNVDDQTNHGQVDGLISKYDASGNRVWTRLVGGDKDDFIQSAVMGADGSVLVSGSTLSSNLDGQVNQGTWDGFISKYDASGNLAWTRLVGGDGNDWLNSAATAADGSVLVIGATDSNSIGDQVNPGGAEGFISKYDASGNRMWTRLVDGRGGYINVNAAFTGADGSVFVSGFSACGPLDGQGNPGASDYYMNKYDANGNILWTRMLDLSWNSDLISLVSTLGSLPATLALSTAQVSALTSADLNALGANDLITVLGTDLIAALTTQQINSINTANINAFSASQLVALRPAQLVALSTAQVLSLRTDKLDALTTQHFTSITTAQIAALSTAQVLGLETADFAVLGAAQLVALSTADIAVLSTAQVVALTTAQVPVLTTAQVQAISTRDIVAMQSDDVRALMTTQVAALTTGQILALAQSANNAMGLYVGGAAGSGLGGQTFAGGNSDAMVARYLADGTGYDSSNAASAGTWLRLLGSDSMSGAGTRQYGLEFALSLVRAADGSAYAVGYVRAGVNSQTYAGGERDAYLIKFGRDGSTKWTQLLGSTGTDSAISLAMGTNGLLYVVGNTTGVLPGAQSNAGGTDTFVATYKDEGDRAIRMDIKEYGTWGVDVAWSVSAALDGSIFVAGEAAGDGVLTKFQSNGSVAWTRAVASWPVKSYDISAGGGTDSNRVVKAGADGSAIVLGITTGKLGGPAAQGTTPSEDAYLIKYNPDGSVAWSKMLGVGPQDVELRGRAMGMSIAADGTICVTGRTALDMGGQSNKGNQDAFVAKYGADGSLIWSRLYGSDKFDEGAEITFGPDGSVYVGGRTNATGDGSMDVLLLKYSADGTLQWSKQVGANGVDMLLALAIDPSYLTLNGAQVAALTSAQINALGAGSMMSTLSTGQLIALSTAQLAALSTLSLTSLGQDQLSALTAPQFVALSTSGVASLKQSQIVALSTIQSAALTAAQVAALSSAQLQALVPNDFAALSSGAIVAMSTSQMSALMTAQLIGLSTRQITSMGTAQIVAMTSAQLSALANNAISVYASGMASSAMDGQSYAGGNGDALLVRYNANGSKVWTRLIGTDSMSQVHGWSPGNEEAVSVANAPDGSVYTVGYVRGNVGAQADNASGCEAYLSKYNSDGTALWTRLIAPMANYPDWANSVTVGVDGMVYVTGGTGGKFIASQPDVNGDSDAFVAKYDDKGVQQWTQVIGSVGADKARSIGVAADGGLVIVGAVGAMPQQAGVPNGQIYSGGESDLFVTKLSVSSAIEWTQLLGTGGRDIATAVALSGDGSIYVAGRTNGNLSGQINSSGGDDVFVSKYDASGSLVWTRLMGSELSDSDDMVGLITSPDGSVYVSGTTTNKMDGQVNAGGSDAFLTKLDGEGNKVWTRLAGGPNWQGSDGLALGPDGAIYMGGWTSNTAETCDALLMKYLPDGTQVWSQQFGGLGRDWFVGFSAIAGPIALATNQLMALSASQLNSLGGASLICTLGTAQLQALTTGQLAGLNGPSALALTLSQTVALATSQVNALSSAALNALSTAQLSVLRPAQLVALSTAQVLSLRTDKLDALTTQQFTSITTAQIAALSTAQVLGLETADFAVLGAAQLVALSTADIAVLSMVQMVALTTAQMPVLKTSQVQAIGTLGMVVMQPEDIRAMITAQVAALTTAQVVAMASTVKNISLDGSTVVSGSTGNNLNGQINHGQYDGFISKYDLSGNPLWTRMIGGSQNDYVLSTVTGVDGSVLARGLTMSSNLDGQNNSGTWDGFISKYDANGNHLWTRIFAENANWDPLSLIGAEGSAIVAGLGNPGGQASQYPGLGFITKYDENGNSVWTRLTNGLALFTSKIGADGSLVLGGGYFSSETHYDGLISKYDAKGNLSWTRLIKGNSEEVILSSQIDSDGSIVVSGYTYSDSLDGQTSHGFSDGFISKYDANGTQMWTRLVGGGLDDGIYRLDLAADGSVVASGSTRSVLMDGQVNYSGQDAFLSKYDKNGTLLWTRLAGSRDGSIASAAQGALGSVIGIDGSVFIGGMTWGNMNGQTNQGAEDGFISKYDANGNHLWTRLVGSTGNDRVSAFLVGVDGSVVVRGTTTSSTFYGQPVHVVDYGAGFIVKYDANGNLLWTQLVGSIDAGGEFPLLSVPVDLPPTLLALSSTQVSALSSADLNALGANGLICVLATDQVAVLTTAQISSLNTLSIAGLRVDQLAALRATQLVGLSTTSIAVISTAQMVAITTAQVQALSTSQVQALTTTDLAVIESRDLQAMTTTQVAAFTTAQVIALMAPTTYADGSVIVLGETAGNLNGLASQGASDGFITRYSATGQIVWNRQIGSSQDDWFVSIAANTDRTLTAVGNTYGSLDGQASKGGGDGFVSRYAPDGSTMWTRVVGSDQYDQVNAASFGRDGSVIVVGETQGSVDGQIGLGEQDGFISKYDANGNKVWTQQIGSDQNDAALAISADSTGAIFVGGYVSGGMDEQIYQGLGDGFLSKYAADGTLAWTRLVGTAQSDWINVTHTMADGSVLVGGTTFGDLDAQTNQGNGDGFISKYDSEGNRVWTRLIGSGQSDKVLAATSMADGAILVAGSTFGNLDGQTNAGSRDGFISKYDASGNCIWTRLTGSNQSDQINAITTRADGSIWVSGYTEGALGGQISPGNGDAFVSQYDAQGNLKWTRIGGSDQLDAAYGISSGLGLNTKPLALSASQLAALSTAQIGALGKMDLLAALGTEQIVALTTSQVSNLSVRALCGLTTSQISSLQTNQVAALSTSGLMAMTTDQLGVLPCGLTSAQKSVLSTSQKAAYIATPIMLDLNGDGVQTLSQDAGVRFDVRANGLQMQTGWISPQDGLLVMDRNGDGLINDGTELFGSSTVLADGTRAQDGYQALAALDSNRDGQINRQDAVFAQLRVWVDANSDGLSTPAELRTLEGWGIASISTQAVASAKVDHGNLLGLVSSYQTTDGQIHQAADVWFGAAPDQTTPTADRVGALSAAIGTYAADQGVALENDPLAPAGWHAPLGGGLSLNQSLASAIQSYQSQAQYQQTVASATTSLAAPASVNAMAAPVENSTRLATGVGLAPTDPLLLYSQTMPR